MAAGTTVPQAALRPTEPDVARVALQAFFSIAERWALSGQEQMRLLGMPARTTFHKWKREGAKKLPQDTLERISYVMGCYKALHLIFQNDRQADTWIRRPNAAAPFNGASALDYMLSGQVVDLADVRRYLDAERG